MATNTTNYGWTKPDYEDAADIMVINGTIDNIDAQVKTVETALDDKADKSTTYTKTEVDTALDSKADTSDIPTVPITAIQKNGTGITPVSGTVNITVPTTAADVSALPDTSKYAAALSLTINSSTYVMTGQLKDQNGDNLGTAQTIDLPLESVVVGGSYNSQTKKVVLTLQNGNTIEFSVADLVAGLQTELSASNKLNPAYINYDSTHRAVSDTEKSTWNGKQNALSSAQLDAVNSGIDSVKVAQITTNKNNILSAENNILLNWEKNRNVYDWHNKTFKAGDSTTITDNNNGTYTVTKSATTTGNSYNYIIIHLDAGSYVLTGCPSGYSVIYMDIRDSSYATVSESTDSGSGSGVFTISTSGDYRLYIILTANVVVSNIIFKPMITPSSVYYKGIPYQPYAMSNAELTAAIQAIQAQLAGQ